MQQQQEEQRAEAAVADRPGGENVRLRHTSGNNNNNNTTGAVHGSTDDSHAHHGAGNNNKNYTTSSNDNNDNSNSNINSGAAAAPRHVPRVARAPMSAAEVEDELDGILYAARLLAELKAHNRHVAETEVRNLREAFSFTVGAEEAIRGLNAKLDKYEAKRREAAAATATTGRGNSSNSSRNGSDGAEKNGRDDAGSGGGSGGTDHSSETTPPPQASTAAAEGKETTNEESHSQPHDSRPQSEDKPNGSGDDGTGAGGDNSTAEAAEGLTSPVVASIPTFRYTPSAKAHEADELIRELEAYVAARPQSWTYEAQQRVVNWRSVLHTPARRRLQILAVFFFNFFTGLPVCAAVTVLLFCCRYTAPLMALYVLYIFTLGRPRWPIPKNYYVLRLEIFRYFRDYFPVRLVVPPAVRPLFDPKKNYMFCAHPHGIHSYGVLLSLGLDVNDASRIFPGITIHLQTLGANFYVPFWRENMVALGAGDASARCLRQTLTAGPGESVCLVVGGAQESLMSAPHSNDLLLLRRKGFIKIALQTGASLVPVYAFGENNVYKPGWWARWRLVRWLSAACKRATGVALPMFHGRGFFTFTFGLLPFRRPIVTVVGAPIDLPRIEHPTAADLQRWQAAYIAALQDLYEQHRGVYDLTSTGLRITD